jgi:hypothetical protein
MCNIFIKVLCCNRRTKDEDNVSEPQTVNVPPFEEMKDVAETFLSPQAAVVKEIVKKHD